MQKTLTIEWTRSVVPPRCRKPRPVVHETECTVDVAETTTEQAPVVIRNHDAIRDGKRPNCDPFEWRSWNDRLWRRADHERFPEVVNGYGYPHNSRDVASADEARDCAQRVAAEFLLVDDELWVPAAEPVWQTCTFGLGHNHGGTSLMLHSRSEEEDGELYWFRLDEVGLALRHARVTAERRSDDESIPSLRYWVDQVEVLDPSVLQATPHAARVQKVLTTASQLGHALAARIQQATDAMESLYGLSDEVREVENALGRASMWRETQQLMDALPAAI